MFMDYLNKLLQEQTGEMGMVPSRGQLTHHCSKKRKNMKDRMIII